MGETYPNEQTIIDELVGIIGMLSNPRGSTLKEIAGVLKSLHGPVRLDLIQDSLTVAELSGTIECKNRRYTVCEPDDVSGRDSLVDVPGCSSWGIGGVPRDSDSWRDASSVSSLSTQAQSDQCMEVDASCPPSECCSIKEILSVKSIQSSGQLSTCSDLYSIKSEESENNYKPKEGKRKGKKRLIVKLPMPKKNSTVESDSQNVVTEKSDECQQETNRETQTQQPLQNVTEDDLCLNKNEDNHLPAKRSMNDIMSKVMEQFLEHNNPNDSQDSNKDVINKEENETKGTHDNITKVMTEVMKTVNNVEQSGSVKAPENDNVAKIITEVMKKVNNVEQSESVKAPEDDNMTKVMNKVMEKVNNFEPSCSIKEAPETSSGVKEESGSASRTLDGVISAVMRRLTGVGKQRSTSPAVLESNDTSLCAADESKIKTASTSVGTEPQDILPSSSTNKVPKSAKRAKRDNESNNMAGSHRYSTRSRTKANELKRSHLQSSSDSDTSLKRAKLS